MKKLFIVSALCLGFTGTAALQAQQGILYVTDFGQLSAGSFPIAGSGLIERISPGGGPGSVSTFASGLSAPNGIVPDGAGNLLFGSTVYNFSPSSISSSIQSIPLTGSAPTTVSSGGSMLGPSGLAFGPGGVLYNGNAYANPGPPAGNGNFSITANTGGTGNLLTGSPLLINPQGLAYGGASNPFLYSTTGNTNGTYGILQINPTTGATNYFAQNSSPGVAAGSFNNPVGLAVGPDGALYVANNSSSNVVRVGVVAPAIAGAAPTLGTVTPYANVTNPEGLTFDTSGNGSLYTVGDNGIVSLIPNISASPTVILSAGAVSAYADLGPNSFPAFITFVAVPEPSTYVIFGVAGLALTVVLRRRQQMSLRA